MFERKTRNKTHLFCFHFEGIFIPSQFKDSRKCSSFRQYNHLISLKIHRMKTLSHWLMLLNTSSTAVKYIKYCKDNEFIYGRFLFGNFTLHVDKTRIFFLFFISGKNFDVWCRSPILNTCSTREFYFGMMSKSGKMLFFTETRHSANGISFDYVSLNIEHINVIHYHPTKKKFK